MLLALQTSSGAHLGFVMFAQKDRFSGDCIVRALPHDGALFETEEFQFLSACQDDGEFAFHVEEDGKRLVIPKDLRGLRFERKNTEERFAEQQSGLQIFGVLVESSDEKTG
jgi:hypothetical protein